MSHPDKFSSYRPDADHTPDRHRARRPALVINTANWLFGKIGWQLEGRIPNDKRLIIVVGPHTSNIDFFIGVLAMLALDIRLCFLAKHSLFVQPFGFILKSLGGVPINRSQPEGFVGEVVGLIRQADGLILAITPEGTRKKVTRLKTGFSRIAGEVPCPLLPVLLDFGGRVVRILEPRPAQTPETDAESYKILFGTVVAKNPDNA